jgi:transcriptional regulator with XRE-family HTH domain
MLYPMKQRTLKEVRTALGLTQVQLEALSGIAQAVISKIERGDVQDPASSTVLKLAAALNVDPRTLRFGKHASAA